MFLTGDFSIFDFFETAFPCFYILIFPKRSMVRVKSQGRLLAQCLNHMGDHKEPAM
jgi:hypothetical protein